MVASPTASDGITAEQCKKDEEYDQDIAHLKTQMDLLTKNLLYGKTENVKDVASQGRDDSASEEEVEELISVLQGYKSAIGWTITDIISIPPGICTHKIQLEEYCTPIIEHQRRLNPPTQEVVKKEIIKWLDAGVVYPILDSKWVSPIQYVPKEGGMTVVVNEKNELTPLKPITGWRVCMDYRKFNLWTLKNHFPMPFMDQMVDRLEGRDMVEYTFEVFMDDFCMVEDHLSCV
ncbi:uncharacterized protein LOC124888851 [Capsicum annuum]|uniref:uncharacterized protein LOC124888851 n=1 Tax=Capsicum annuum TaxID=4072 RepID=UPI001FB16A3A|nr:uncharacterized protein LOC124888851 [Capsicum annuum]